MKILEFPELRQTYEYDCGANALQGILAYYGMEIREELIIKSAKTNKIYGTSIFWMEKTLEKYNLKFDWKKMTVKDLKKYIDKKIPIIILLQARNWKEVDYTKDFKDGHRVVAIWYDWEEIIFEDPYSLERTFLSESELKKRRHSKEKNKKIMNYGIAVYGKKPSYDEDKLIHMD